MPIRAQLVALCDNSFVVRGDGDSEKKNDVHSHTKYKLWCLKSGYRIIALVLTIVKYGIIFHVDFPCTCGCIAVSIAAALALYLALALWPYMALFVRMHAYTHRVSSEKIVLSTFLN